MTLTVSGLGIARIYAVPQLTIDSVDQDTNIVSGTTVPDARMWTLCNTADGQSSYNFSADGSGNYHVNLMTDLANNGHACNLDIVPGSGFIIDAQLAIGIGHSAFYYNVMNPKIGVWLDGFGTVGVTDFPLGNPAVLSIHDPSTSDPDYIGTINVVAVTCCGRQTEGSLNMSSTYPLKPGMEVTVSSGGVSKTVTIFDFTITADPDTNRVTGTTRANSHVFCWLDRLDGSGNVRQVLSGAGGEFTADYNVPGDNQGSSNPIYDIQPGDHGHIEVSDDAGNSVSKPWQAPYNPFVVAQMPNNEVDGWNWPGGDTIRLTIDPKDGGDVYTATTVAQPTSWSNGQNLVKFPLTNLTIKPGMVVSMINDVVIRTTTVVDLKVTNVVVAADTVSGTGHPGDLRHVIVDGDGKWTVDFAHASVDRSGRLGPRKSYF